MDTRSIFFFFLGDKKKKRKKKVSHEDLGRGYIVGETHKKLSTFIPRRRLYLWQKMDKILGEECDKKNRGCIQKRSNIWSGGGGRGRRNTAMESLGYSGKLGMAKKRSCIWKGVGMTEEEEEEEERKVK